MRGLSRGYVDRKNSIHLIMCSFVRVELPVFGIVFFVVVSDTVDSHNWSNPVRPKFDRQSRLQSCTWTLGMTWTSLAPSRISQHRESLPFSPHIATGLIYASTQLVVRLLTFSYSLEHGILITPDDALSLSVCQLLKPSTSSPAQSWLPWVFDVNTWDRQILCWLRIKGGVLTSFIFTSERVSHR